MTEDKVTNPSENVIQQSTDSPVARPQDSRRTSSPTVATATLHAMTVSYKQTTPAIAMDTPPAHNMAAVAKQPVEPHYDMDAEPTVAVTQATDAVAMVTDEGVRVEAGVPYQSEFGVDLDEEECDCDMEEYGEDEIEPPDTYSRWVWRHIHSHHLIRMDAYSIIFKWGIKIKNAFRVLHLISLYFIS